MLTMELQDDVEVIYEARIRMTIVGRGYDKAEIEGYTVTIKSGGKVAYSEYIEGLKLSLK